MSVFRSGLRFSFRAQEVPKPRVRKRSFSLTITNAFERAVKVGSLVKRRQFNLVCIGFLEILLFLSPSGSVFELNIVTKQS